MYFHWINNEPMKKYILFFVASFVFASNLKAQQTQKPPLHGKDWVAITGKPLAATAGSMVFQKGGNAVDAACAMLAATCTMWDVLSWGGETQALIYNPKTKKVKNYHSEYNIRCITEDDNNNLWIGTVEGGLLLFDRKTGTTKKYTTQNGLSSNTVLRLLEDKNGN